MIVRWERGERSPTVETVLRCLDVCGFELEMTPVPRSPNGVDPAAISRHLRLSPTDRLDLAAAEAAALSAFDKALGRT